MKSTFQKPDATYPHGSLREQPEEWRDISGYEGMYQVSSKGRIKSLERTIQRGNKRPTYVPEIILKPSNLFGYNVVRLARGGDAVNKRVHRLVCEEFLINPENKPQVNHKNGKRDDNRLENLEWCTASENSRHLFDVLGYSRPGVSGERHPFSKLTDADVIEFYNHLKADGSVYSFAKKKGVTKQTLQGILKQGAWPHLNLDWKSVYPTKKSLKYAAGRK